MNELQPVAAGQLPSYLAGSKYRLNAAAHAGVFASFAVLGIRGSKWWVKYGGNSTLVTHSPGFDARGKPLPEQPQSTIQVVIVGVSHALSKQYWEGGFEQDSASPPDCFSVSGVAPEPSSPRRQSPTCGACPHNVWGSVITAAGRKAKRCQDNKRLALVPYGDIPNEANGGPMLLRIPPASLKMFDQYASKLDRVGVDISQVVTTLSFNPDVTHQQIMFNDAGFIPEEHWPDVVEHLGSDGVRRILEEGALESPQEVAPPPGFVPPVVEEAPAPPPPVQPTPTPTPTPTLLRNPAPPPPPRPRPTPFGRPVVNTVPPTPLQPAPAPAPQPAPEPPKPAAAAPMPTVVQGAPSDLQNVIDRLLEDDE